MALVKSNLKNNIKTLLNELKNHEDQDVGIEKFANDLADAIHSYVSAAEVTTNVSTTVNTVLAGTAGGFPVTGTGTGSGSGNGTGGLI